MQSLLIVISLFSPFLGVLMQKQNTSISGKWKLMCFQSSENSISDCRPSGFSDSSLIFDFTNNGVNGEIIGRTIINTVFGKYELNENQIKVDEFGGTLVMEYGWGMEFWSTIKQSSSYQLMSDTLIIFYEQDRKSMVFTRSKNRFEE